MEFILIKQDCLEWEYIWNWMGNHPINEGLPDPKDALNPINGEQWAYMGSFKQGNKIIHMVRHRLHPTTNRIESLNLHASEAMNDECILPKK